MLFEIADVRANEVLHELDKREMCERGYVRQSLAVHHAHGLIQAVAYTSDDLPDPIKTDFDTAYKTARGSAGPTSEYIDRTREFIRRIEVPDHWPIADDGLPNGFNLWDTQSECASRFQEPSF
jgi:cation transport regulator ChaC